MYFTELDQVDAKWHIVQNITIMIYFDFFQKDWEKYDEENPIVYGPDIEAADYQGEVVPRIECPISRRKHKILQRWLRRSCKENNIRFQNAVSYYAAVKIFVLNNLPDEMQLQR